MTWADFAREYEDAATTHPRGDVNVLVLHSGGTHGRTPNRGRAAGYAMAASAADRPTATEPAPVGEGPDEVPPSSARAHALDYAQATRFEPAAPANYQAMNASRMINRVIIHITEGPSMGSAINTFQNPASQVSAHYIVGQDGEVVQMVHDNDVAWHARGGNSDSIGIEHVGSTGANPKFPRVDPTDAQYCASAALTRWLCDTYGIPKDETHIVGHAQAVQTSKTCPGPYWDWNYYRNMVRSETCAPRTQSQSLGDSAAPETAGRGPLRPPPPPLVAARAMDARIEIASAVLGAGMERILNSDGGVKWELDQLRGLKHPNDQAPANPPPFRDGPVIRLDRWPSVEIMPLFDQLSAWFTVEWQCNGRSLGNVRITNVGTNGALIGKLLVSARIMDDNILYPPNQPTQAALRIRFHYQFTGKLDSDEIAIVDLHLYANGTYDQSGRWEQQ